MLHMADSNLNPGVATPESHAGMDQVAVGAVWELAASESEPETMQERRGNGTEAKLSNLINQLEELLLLIKEGPKVIRSQSPESDNKHAGHKEFNATE